MSELEELYHNTRRGTYALALSITRSGAEAEDAVQEAFFKLARNPAPAKMTQAYIFTAVRNCAYDIVRRRKRQSLQSDRLLVHAQVTAEPTAIPLIDAEDLTLLNKALAELDDHFREVIVLKLYSKLTFAQMTQVLNEPLTTIASRYTTALKHLKKSLESKYV